jgi:selenoprotein W-related protein
MKIKIYYCEPCYFISNAVGLADELRRVFNVSARLIPGYNGLFDVVVDGQIIFSRLAEKHFPESG